MVLETIFNYLRGKKRTLAESDSDLPVDAEHVQGGSKRFRNAESHPQSGDRIYITSQPVLPASPRAPAAPPASSNALPPQRSESAPIQHSKSLSSLDTNRRIIIAPPTLAPSNFKFTYTASQTLPSSTTSAPATAPRPERKLKKNPNGPISYNGQWKSSSKKLNRHASPAFQVPARKPRADAKDTYEVPADSKRRRVEGAADPLPSGQASASSSQSASGSAAASQVTTTAPRASSISPPKPSTLTIPSSSRLRTPAKPTTPVRPSPLRQTWSSQPQPSPPHTQTAHLSPNHTQPTQTATFMAELITKTEPPRRNFDVSNPYQTANPVANAIPPRRATRRTKKPLDRGAIAAQKAKEVEKETQKGGEKKEGKEKAEKEKDKAPYVSAQAQIEATLPPGSKRSRPPANLFSQTSSNQTTSTVKSYIVEEVTENSEDSSRSAKRSKPSLTSPASAATPKPPSVLASEPTIMDLDEVDNSSKDKSKGKQAADNATTTKPSTPTTPSPFGNVSRQPTLKSIPKEPSKLRNSFLPETTTASPTSSAGAPSPPPIAPAPLFPSFSAGAPAAFAAPAAPPAAVTSATDAPFSFQPPSLPPAPKITPPSASSFTFKPAVPSPSQDLSKDDKDKDIMDTDVDNEDVKKRVRAMDEKALPTFNFVFSASVSSTTDTSREDVRGREDVKVLPVAALPSFTFNIDGAKPTGSSASGGFKFDLPGSSAGSSSKPFLFGNTAAVATSSNAAPAASAPPFMFGSSKGSAPAPAAPAPAPAPTGFNWAAAGMKAPETKDKWLCAVCDVRNDNALKKCVACESDKPAGAPASSSSSASASTSLFGSAKPAPPAEAPRPPVAPAVVGFNWAAAGMKAPDTSDKWVCAVCDVRNAQSAKKCVSCESDKPGAAAPSTASSAPTSLFGSSKPPAPVEVPKPPAVVGFNWAAAGMKAPDTSDKWVCAVCDVRNAQATKKCVSCESDKPGAAASSSSSTSSHSLFGSSKPAPVEMPKPPTAPAVVGFNWAAAGIKAPDLSDKWTCAVCDVRNAQSAKQCVSCESDKRGAAASSSNSKSSSASTSLFGSSTPTPTPPAAPTVTAFNWAAAGMKVPDTSNKWTCTLCGLSNEQKAEQCETCETPR